MSKRRKEHEQQAYAAGRARAEGHPSRIRATQTVVEQVMASLDQNGFAFRSELYQMLADGPPEKRREILAAYTEGLTEVDEAGRLSYRLAGELSTNGSYFDKVFVDAERDLLILTSHYHSESSDKAKRKGYIHCYRLSDGKELWSYELRVKETAWRALIYGDLFIFLPIKERSDSESGADIPYALSLETGKLVWKYEGKGGGDQDWVDDIKAIHGVFGEYLYVSSSSYILLLDPKTGEEKVSHRASSRYGSDYFLPAGEFVILQLWNRKLGWFDVEGNLVRELELEFPVGEDHEGDISFIQPVGGTRSRELFVGIRGSGYEYEEGTPEHIGEWAHWRIYAVAIDGSTFRIVADLPDLDIYARRVFVHGKRLYLAGDKQTVSISRSTQAAGRTKALKRSPFVIHDIVGDLAYGVDGERVYTQHSLFSVRNMNTGEVLWEREDFEFSATVAGCIYGIEEEEDADGNRISRALVLDPETGQERVAIELGRYHSPRVRLIDGERFLVTQGDVADLYKVDA